MKTRNQFFHRVCYLLCIVLLCILDQRKGSVTGVWQMILPNCSVLCILLLVIPSCRLRDFRRWSCAIWLLLWMLFLPGSVLWGRERILAHFALGQWISGVVSVGLWGVFAIRGWHMLRATKGFTLRSYVHTHIFQLALLVLLTLFGISDNDALWPLQYFVMGAAICLTEITAKERHLMLRSLQDGLILSFFLIQGMAFVFRPYDSLRYHGMYSNTNINALFYLLVYCSLLSKICIYMQLSEKKKRMIGVAFSLFFGGAMWSFVLLTSCRSAMVAMIFATAIAGIYCLVIFDGKRIRKGLGLISGLILCMLIGFPLVYGSVRYLPPLFHHPIWFYDEYAEYKVHSWDPWDSPKYVTWQQVLEYNFARLLKIIEHPAAAEDSSMLPERTFQRDICWAETSPVDAPVMLLATSKLKASMFSPIQMTNTMETRWTIYQHYVSELNLIGHKNSENGIQVSEYYYAPHAHDLYLQFAFSFGIPAGVLFAFFTVFCLGGYVWIALRKRAGTPEGADFCSAALYYGAILIFGLTEMVWTNGQLSFVLLFVLPLVFPPEGRKSGADGNVIP